MRIYDDPNHPEYGPVRRMWVILVQLDLADKIDRHTYGGGAEAPWDVELARTVKLGVRESDAQRTLLSEYLQRMKL